MRSSSLSDPILTVEARRNPDKQFIYKAIGGVDLKLHVFNPASHQTSDRKPGIVFFFGGGWTAGSPNQFYEQADFLARKGIVAISAEYRVQSRNGTSPFEAVQDAKSAVRWVRAHAAELGVDPDRLVASGGSAGGHLAACTGVIDGFDEAKEDHSVSSIPNAMILFNPVLDTTARGFGLEKVTEARQTDISPNHHIHSGIAATLLLHGTADTTVPFENAERFTRLMKEAGNRCELIPFKGLEHAFFNGKYFQPQKEDLTPYKKSMDACVQFLISIGYLD